MLANLANLSKIQGHHGRVLLMFIRISGLSSQLSDFTIIFSYQRLTRKQKSAVKLFTE